MGAFLGAEICRLSPVIALCARGSSPQYRRYYTKTDEGKVRSIEWEAKRWFRFDRMDFPRLMVEQVSER